MSVDKPHLVKETLSDTGDEIANVAQGSPDGSTGFARAEPRIDLELSLAGDGVFDELEIEVEMLEVTSEFPAWAFDFDNLGVDLDDDAFGDVHRLR